MVQLRSVLVVASVASTVSPSAAWCFEAWTTDVTCTGDPAGSLCGTGDECVKVPPGGALTAGSYQVTCTNPGDAASGWSWKWYNNYDCKGLGGIAAVVGPGPDPDTCVEGLKVDCSKGPPPSSSSKLSTGAIVGITAGSLLLVAICALGFYKAAPRSGAVQ